MTPVFLAAVVGGVDVAVRVPVRGPFGCCREGWRMGPVSMDNEWETFKRIEGLIRERGGG